MASPRRTPVTLLLACPGVATSLAPFWPCGVLENLLLQRVLVLCLGADASGVTVPLLRKSILHPEQGISRGQEPSTARPPRVCPRRRRVFVRAGAPARRRSPWHRPRHGTFGAPRVGRAAPGQRPGRGKLSGPTQGGHYGKTKCSADARAGIRAARKESPARGRGPRVVVPDMGSPPPPHPSLGLHCASLKHTLAPTLVSIERTQRGPRPAPLRIRRPPRARL